VATWIRQLEDDDFTLREAAEKELAACGEPCLAPLERALDEAALEGRVRGVHVLATIAAKAEREETRDAAFDAVERLARSEHADLALHAAPALGAIQAARKQESLDWFVNQGATWLADLGELRIGPTFRGGDQDIRRLAYLADVRHIRFEGEKVSPLWIEQLARLPMLEEVTLKRVRLTPASVEQLGALQDLTSLKLMYLTFPNDPSPSLAKLAKLQYASLFGTNITPEQAQQLARAQPRAQWDIRRGAFLGVHVQRIVTRAEVSTVQPGSAAQRAGIQVGDTLLSLAGEKIATFEDLQTVVGRLDAGSEVDVEIQRNEQPMRLKIRLGEWE
jgi:hypothetical protein